MAPDRNATIVSRPHAANIGGAGVESRQDFVSGALKSISSTFGRLSLVASLRNSDTGVYSDTLAGLAYGTRELDAALRQKHMEVFLRWLSMDLRSQTEELVEHFEKEGYRAKETAARWIVKTPCESLLPAGVREHERMLFQTGLEMAIALAYARL
jgi:hypothetical protein